MAIIIITIKDQSHARLYREMVELQMGLGKVKILCFILHLRFKICWHNLMDFNRFAMKTVANMQAENLIVFHLLVLPAFLVGLLVAPTFSFYTSRELL